MTGRTTSVARFVEHLTAEHQLIDRMAGAFRTYVERRVVRAAGPEDARSFFAFFREFAGAWHHVREEAVLFGALVRDAGVPAAMGPLAALREDHEWLRTALDGMEPLLSAERIEASCVRTLREAAEAWSHTLWLHIDAERSVLFPEAQHRLARAGTFELDEPLPTPAQRDSRDEAVGLLDRYPRSMDWHVVRGDGCVVCPSFGVRCDGIEREWWSEAEWEEFPDHLG